MFVLTSLLISISFANPCVVYPTALHYDLFFYRREFSQIIDALGDALDFSRTIGADANTTPYERGGSRNTLEEVDFYTRYALQRSLNFLLQISLIQS